MRLYPRDRALRSARARGDRVRAAAARGLDRPRPARLRDRRRPRGERRGRPRAPRLHDQRDGAAARRRRRSSIRTAGATTSRRGVLRTVSPRSFEEDPLRLVRGLRFVSQLGLEPDEATLAQMHEHAGVVVGRLGRADRRRARGRRAWASSRSCCSAASRARRSSSPATRASSSRCCPSSGPAIGFDADSSDHAMTARRAHLRGRAGRRGRRVPACRCGSRRSSTTSASRAAGGRATTPSAGAQLAAAALAPAALPERRCGSGSCGSCAHHTVPARRGRCRARPAACSRGYGDGLTFDLLDHWHADLRGREPTPRARRPKLERLARVPRASSSRSSRARTASPTSPSTAPT